MTTTQFDPRLRANIAAAIQEAESLCVSVGIGSGPSGILGPDIAEFMLPYHLGALHMQLFNAGLPAEALAEFCRKHKLPYKKEGEAELYPPEPVW